MTIRYATIWNDQKPRAAPLEEQASSKAERVEVPMENTAEQTKKSRTAKVGSRKMCSGERLAALLDTHRWTQRRPNKK